jgi:hypothetical protein
MKVTTRGVSITEIFTGPTDDAIEVNANGEEIVLMLTDDANIPHTLTLNRKNFDQLLTAMQEAGSQVNKLWTASLDDEQGNTL